MTFPAHQRFLVKDYETYSEAPLRDCGSWEYSVHPSTEVLCVSWALGTLEEFRSGKFQIHSWCPHLPDGSLSIQLLLSALQDPSVIVAAHNALFEFAITRNVLARRLHTQEFLREIPVSRFLCTAALAAAMALPRSLEGVGKALDLPFKKDMEGKRVLDRLCKPKRPSKKDPSTRDMDPEKLRRLVEYNRADIAAEVAVLCALPQLHPTERAVWELDQTINLRGFRVDRRLVRTILDMVAAETATFDERMSELTSHAVESPRRVAALRAWLEVEGVAMPDLAAGTVDEFLGYDWVKGNARAALKLRQAASKSSTAKYVAFDLRSRSDGRCRDNLIYHRASTGRWGGAGVQPQNLAKPSIKDVDQAIDVIRDGDLEMIRLLYGEPMDIFSSCLRGMIVAPKGHTLDVADYNAIEARVLFWVAGDETGLSAFRQKRDLSKEQAAEVFGVPVTQIGDDSFERFIGKGLILGCGFSMGWKKFADTCAKQGQPVADDLAQRAVKAYRRAHPPVVQLWRNLESAAISAVHNPGKTFAVGPVAWTCGKRFLYCRLPSGRRLAYYGPTVAYEANPYNDDQPRPVLYHWGEDSTTKQWREEKTYGGKLTENVVQAIARDLMAAAMLRIEAAGPWRIVLSVHDELMAERALDVPGTHQEFCDLMQTTPEWAKGLPVIAKGYSAKRYRK